MGGCIAQIVCFSAVMLLLMSCFQLSPDIQRFVNNLIGEARITNDEEVRHCTH